MAVSALEGLGVGVLCVGASVLWFSLPYLMTEGPDLSRRLFRTLRWRFACRLFPACQRRKRRATALLRWLLRFSPGRHQQFLTAVWVRALQCDGPLLELAIENGRRAASPWTLASRIALGDLEPDLEAGRELDREHVYREIVEMAWPTVRNSHGYWMDADDRSRSTYADAPAAQRLAERLIYRAASETLRSTATSAAFDRPELRTRCLNHGVLPAAPADRAAFLVLAGALDQYRALDPDGGLLATAYAAAAPDRRLALRSALAELGDFDLLRLIAAGGRRVTEEERDYLVRTLTDREQWADLWRWVRELPLADAVEAAAAMGDWRPPDDADARLFELFVRADPEEIWWAPGAGVHTIPAPARPLACGISPDGTRLAVVTAGGVTERRLTDGTVLLRRSMPRRNRRVAVLHLGDAIVVGDSDHSGSVGRLVCYTPSDTTVVYRRPVSAVVRAGAGFVVSHPDGAFTVHPDVDSPAAHNGHVSWAGSEDVDPTTLAAAPTGDRVGFGGAKPVVLDVDGSRPRYPHGARPPCLLGFLSGERVVTARTSIDSAGIDFWQLDDDRLLPTVADRLPEHSMPSTEFRYRDGLLSISGPQDHPHRRLAAIVSFYPPGWGAAGREALEAALPAAFPDHPLARSGGWWDVFPHSEVWYRPGGPIVRHTSVTGGSPTFHVVWLVNRLVTAGPEHHGPGALQWLTALIEWLARSDPLPDRPGLDVLRLILARLEHKYDGDIVLDGGRAGTAAEIALGSVSGRRG